MKICIIGMVYKSVAYCDFMIDQLSRFSDSSIEIKVLANDPTPEVAQHLPNLGVPFRIRKDAHPEAHYLERVYRGWNECIEYAEADLAILVNSDMGYSPRWDTALVDSMADDSIVTSRLVESGKMPSGTHGISKNFGRSPDQYDEAGFLEFAESIKCNRLHTGGLYSPVCLWADKFTQAGGFPEGNINGVPGDKIAFERCGMKHQTNFDSIVYHIQEGEMDE
tara:strand:- start:9067 stop:9732 length:666 start_codon:yes stop_codon:yes gene_type:complete